MLARCAPVIFLVSALAGCDFVAIAPDTTAERPAGWESLDDEGAATRLYYQFVDGRRQVRFVERLEEVPESARASVGFVELDVPPPLTPGDAARARAKRRTGSGTAVASASGAGLQVVLYSAEWCGACQKAKRHLDRRGIAYELRDIDLPHYAEELVEKTGRRAVPVIDVDGRMLTGFSAKSYDELIESV